jgi:hypothetical protein
MVYSVPEDEVFDNESYPDINYELQKMADMFVQIPGDHIADIVISYYKDRRIQTEYIARNKHIVEILLSGQLSSYHIESLFASLRDHSKFLQHFEDFIKTKFNYQMKTIAPEEMWTTAKLRTMSPFLENEVRLWNERCDAQIRSSSRGKKQASNSITSSRI